MNQPASNVLPRLVRTTSDHPDFRALVALLDHYLAAIDGAEHAFYAQLNKIDRIRHVVLAYLADEPVGCGAFREFGPGVVEVKRMYVQPAQRGQGVAAAVLTELESWARELGYTGTVLETGLKQSAAIRLYERSGYGRTPNYGQYLNVENSVCMSKVLA
jgi:putative acetyltransferase